MNQNKFSFINDVKLDTTKIINKILSEIIYQLH